MPHFLRPVQILSPEARLGSRQPGELFFPDGFVLPPGEPFTATIVEAVIVWNEWVPRDQGGGFAPRESAPAETSNCCQQSIFQQRGKCNGFFGQFPGRSNPRHTTGKHQPSFFPTPRILQPFDRIPSLGATLPEIRITSETNLARSKAKREIQPRDT